MSGFEMMIQAVSVGVEVRDFVRDSVDVSVGAYEFTCGGVVGIAVGGSVSCHSCRELNYCSG